MSDREAQGRAEAILRDRLTPAQLADVEATDWFNVRDAVGRLWRVCAFIKTQYSREDKNLTDEYGNGRHVYPPVEFLPGPDVALTMLLFFSDEDLSNWVQTAACGRGSLGRTMMPDAYAKFYAGFKETVGGGPRQRRRDQMGRFVKWT